MTSLRHVSLIENTCAFLFLKLFYFWNIYFVSEQSWLVKIIQSMYTSAKSHIMTSGQKVETAEAAYGRDSTPVVPTSPNTHSFRNVLLEARMSEKVLAPGYLLSLLFKEYLWLYVSVWNATPEPDPSRDFESGPQHFQGSLISALLPDDFSALFEGVNVTGAQMTITDDGPLLPGIYLWCCVETWPSHLLLRLKYWILLFPFLRVYLPGTVSHPSVRVKIMFYLLYPRDP